MNPSINPSVSLLKHFESIDEPRTEYLIEHQLLDIIAITICAVICGAESWVEIEEYGYSKIDAMGTQKEIAQEIIEGGGDYILSLKGNIHQDVQQLFDCGLKTQFENMPHEAYSTINKGHGRIEIRRHWLLSSVEHLIDAQLWSGLKRWV